jgi:hypothetical protein
VEQLLGEELLSPDAGREPFETGLRHRFLGDMPRPSIDALLVEACNCLAAWPDGRVVLAFEAIDAADEATVKTLAQIFERPGWLRLPLLLTVRGTPQGLVTELLYLLCHEAGNAAVIEMASDGDPSEGTASCDWTALPPDVLRVLRAGSVLGITFEAELVARLLEEPLSTVFEKLQWAADAGIPFTDRGEGRFALPPGTMAALQSSILPSLLMFWHARLGAFLSGGQPVGEVAGRVWDGEGTPRTVPRGRRATQAEEAFDLPQGSPEADLHTSRPITRYAELFAPLEHSGLSEAVPPVQTVEEETMQAPAAGEQTVGARQTTRRTVPPSNLPGDQTRAAAHLQAAGRTEDAVAHYLAAVRRWRPGEMRAAPMA